MSGPSRGPARGSIDLYPGLVVHDDRCGGWITLGVSRLPAWCLWPAWPNWDTHSPDGEREPGAPHYGVRPDDLAALWVNLLSVRGEFARLLLVLANAERCDRLRGGSWRERRRHRQRVSAQLRRCLKALAEGGEHG